MNRIIKLFLAGVLLLPLSLHAGYVEIIPRMLVIATPEPSSLSLLICGLMLLAGFRWIRRKK